MTFETVYSRLRVTEGGYSKSKTDRGGETYAGISRVHHPNWEGWAVIDGHFLRGGRPEGLSGLVFLNGLVQGFYRREFWGPLCCDLLPHRVAGELFDSAVNCSPARAVRWLQHAANLIAQRDILVVDGVMGQRTITKVCVQTKNFGDGPLLKAMNGQQYMHYQRLVEADPTQRVYFRGWLTRVWEEA